MRQTKLPLLLYFLLKAYFKGSSWSPACYRGDTNLIQGQLMCGSFWTQWHWKRFLRWHYVSFSRYTYPTSASYLRFFHWPSALYESKILRIVRVMKTCSNCRTHLYAYCHEPQHIIISPIDICYMFRSFYLQALNTRYLKLKIKCVYIYIYIYATSRKVADSIPDGVTGIFHWHNPSGRTMALGLTQPLTKMSARSNSLWVKAAGA
jgi:hypothetical protein